VTRQEVERERRRYLAAKARLEAEERRSGKPACSRYFRPDDPEPEGGVIVTAATLIRLALSRAEARAAQERRASRTRGSRPVCHAPAFA